MATAGQRDPQRERFWRQHVRQHQDSGLTVRAYCQQHQLTEASFYAWRRTLAERDGETTPTAPTMPAFVPVVVTGVPTTAPLELHWPTGPTLHIHAHCPRTLLADVLALLEERGC